MALKGFARKKRIILWRYPLVQTTSSACGMEAGQGASSDSRRRARRAKKLLHKAMKLRHELVPDDRRAEPDLVDDDWDGLVYYFFR
jgi:hypothetical protein